MDTVISLDVSLQSDTSPLPFLKPPYAMNRQEWQENRQSNKTDGAPIYKGNHRSSRKQSMSRLANLQYLHYGVQQWLHDKALQGCEDSLEKITYGYDAYDELIAKAKQEGHKTYEEK